MHVDYLRNDDGRIHAINCRYEPTNLEIGILCLVSFAEDTATISSDKHRFFVEIPKEFRSCSERVKVFNAALNVLNHGQV